MNKELKTDQLLDLAAKQEGYPSVSNLGNYLKYIFDKCDLQGVRMLDIGGGNGLFSFYAACRGAAEVVCLEPGADGSSHGIDDVFKHWAANLKAEEVVTLGTETLDEYESGGKSFDVVLLHHAINHLDETACINLRKSESSRLTYMRIFEHLAGLCHSGGHLIVSDCSCYNVFPLLGLRNRYCPSIEWHKHQSPRVWCGLLEKAGFCETQVRWDPFGRFNVGPIRAFFLTSHFCITARR